MFDQKLLFKTMLWSLGVAAFLGVVAVLIADFDVVGRVTATAFLTSAVAALLWQAAARLERNELSIWTAQLGAILFYACALCGIWEIGNEAKLWATGFVLLGCSVVAAGGWAAQVKQDFAHTGIVAAVLALIVAACWLWGIWIETYREEMMLTGFALAGWGTAGALCLVGSGSQPTRQWRWVGVVGAAIGVVLSEYAILMDVHEPWVMKSLFVVGSVAAVVIHSVLCYASVSAPKQLTIRQIAVVSTIVTALLVDVITIQEISGDQIVLRLAIAAAIVASTSTIATAFIIQSHWRQSRISRGSGQSDVEAVMKDGRPERMADYQTLRIECPQCSLQSELPVGSSKCPQCGLQFRIEIMLPVPSRPESWLPEGHRM